MKERSRSPHRRIPPPPPAADDAKRKISIGPVDFAKRRETIKLAYSKSIRESEARDAARRQAAERKRRAKEAAEAAAKVSREEPHVAAQPTQSPPRTAPSRPEPAISDLPLKVTTTFPVQQQPHNVEGDSPTLGIPAIPGGFPGLAPPRTDDAPQSAISDVTNVTEFDNEMQTEPARNQDLNAPELDHLRQSTVSVRTKAVYQYPFEDESPKDANDDTIPIKISVDAPPSPGEQPSATSELNIEQPVPGAYRDDDEYEPQPYVSPSYETTVTIIGRHSDIVPADESSGVGPSRIHDYDEQDEYKIRLDNVEPSTLRHISRQQVQTPASESEAEDQQLERLEEFYVGPYLPERSSKWHEPVREARDVKLSAASSDGASDDQKYAYSDHQRTPDTSHSLSVPSMLTPANRYSQQTVWTDFSIDSDAGSDMVPHAERIVVSRDSAGRGRHPSRPVEVRSPALQWGTEQGRFTQSPDLSPLEDSATTPFPDVSQLPEIDSGAEFRTSYLAAERPRQDSLTVPDLPDHEPPPIPTSSVASTNDYTRPNSSVYDDVRPGSLMMRDDRSSYMDVSRRQSEDFTQSLMTPPSVDKISVEVLEVPLNHQQPLGDERKQSEVSLPAKDGQEKADKERNRLRQRYNIIKEIVDTEMVFVRDMNVVEEIYKGTAEACPKLDNKTIKLIFRNTDEIISFHTAFVASLKEAVSSVYTPKGGQSPPTPKDDATATDAATVSTAGSATTSAEPDLDEAKDRQTKIGPVFLKHMEKMKAAHEGFLRSSDAATKRLIQIQEDKTVKLWLNECDAVAKDLTQAWNLDSLLVKPMQRITKYPVLLSQLIQQTSPDHPDFEALTTARIVLETAILDINKSKKNFELVGQIVGRKRKESDVKAGFARAFGKRVDKLQASSNRPPEDAEYQKLNEKFQDDYLKLQVVLRDVEYYTRQVTEYVHEFLKYLSSMELIMRLQPSPFPEIESRWVQFNVSMRDLEKITLEQHVSHDPPRSILTEASWSSHSRSSPKFGDTSLSRLSLSSRRTATLSLP